MHRYDPLTHRSKHELREIDADPWAWMEGPERRNPWSRFHVGPLLLMIALAMLLVAWLGFAVVWMLEQLAVGV